MVRGTALSGLHATFAPQPCSRRAALVRLIAVLSRWLDKKMHPARKMPSVLFTSEYSVFHPYTLRQLHTSLKAKCGAWSLISSSVSSVSCGFASPTIMSNPPSKTQENHNHSPCPPSLLLSSSPSCSSLGVLRCVPLSFAK